MFELRLFKRGRLRLLDRAGQEIALVVSSFSGAWAFWAVSCAAFRQIAHQSPPFAVLGERSGLGSNIAKRTA